MKMVQCVRPSPLTPKPWNKGCGKATLADETCSMSYLSAQIAVVLDLGSERNSLQFILTRIRDLISFHPRAYNLIFKV